MADMMNFPKRWEDFLHDYEFEDARRIYTNGSRIIQSFRVKQMMEHYATARHGRWVMTVYTTVSKRKRIISNKKFACSECAYSNGRKQSNYCPNCGAKMDGGAD